MKQQFSVIVADPPYAFQNPLKCKDGVKRSAADIYPTLSIKEIAKMKVLDLAKEDSLLCLWVPSSLLPEGLEILKAWGFVHKQTYVWVKTIKQPFKKFLSSARGIVSRCFKKKLSIKDSLGELRDLLVNFDFSLMLGFGMGRVFRQSHEIALIGTRGKITSKIKNKSQRSVTLAQNIRHSQKPELLQNQLELMLPASDGNTYLEIFGRRKRDGWTVLGNEVCKDKDGKPQDIRDSIEDLLI